MLYILETHPEKLRALVAENIKLRQFVSLVRKFGRSQHALVQNALKQLPRIDDSNAWETAVLDSREETDG
ncbi:MAG TPA: hypothetical protein VE008_07185 [Burkholderiales bacterium]|nr:hypothetical protein [Burkholderiales bacterium]